MKKIFGFLTRARSLEPSQATLYLELRGNELHASHLPNAHRPPGAQVVWVDLPLPDRTVINGVLFKPAALARAVIGYLAAHHLVNPQAFVCFSTPATPGTPARLFTVFSLALALKRVPLSLAKVVAPPATDTPSPATLEAALEAFERLPDELAPFRPPAGRSPTRWLLVSATVIALGVAVGGIVHWRTYHDVRTLGRAVDHLQAAISQEQVKVKNLAALIRETGALESLVAQATKVQASTNNCLTLLNTLSQHLPKNLLITSIKLERDAPTARGAASTSSSVRLTPQKNNKKNQIVGHHQAAHGLSAGVKKSVTVVIQGTSTTSSGVSRFLQTLGEPHSGITNPVLTALGHIKKARKKATPASHQTSGTTRRYHFTITGQLEE